VGTRKIWTAAAVAALVVCGLSLGIATSATYVTSWGSRGSGPGQFGYPYGVAVDAQRHVYVADTSNRRIEKFSQP
jgi:NHL repeat